MQRACGVQAAPPRGARVRRCSTSSALRPARCSAAAPPAIQRRTHTAPGGVTLEVLHASGGAAAASKPPLLFVHGSFHAAWCWAEHWLGYYAALGYDAHAVSLRGQGGSDAPPGAAAVAGTLETHAADVASLAAALPRPPVLIGHSFGGLVVQQCLSRRAPSRPALAGIALLCSVPPAGNGPMASRMLRATPLRALRVTYAFISAAFKTDAALCRDTFFSPELLEADLLRHQASIAATGSTRLLDLRALNASLPVQADVRGLPVWVCGAADDAVVDCEGVRETAAALGAPPPLLLPGIGHDVMLDARWRSAADALAAWLAQECKA